MLVVILFLAMPTMPMINTNLQDMTATEMDEVVFNCNSAGEPAVTYEWFYTNTSGRLF